MVGGIMTPVVILYVVILLASASLSAWVAVAALRRHAAHVSGWLAACLGAAAAWSILAALEALAPSPPLKILIAKALYVAVASVAPSWLMFGLAYAGRESIVRGLRRIAVWLPSAVILMLVWTNEWHGLAWEQTVMPTGGLGPLNHAFGPAVMIFAAWSYGIVLAGSAFVLHAAFRAPPAHRRYVVPIGLSAIFPVILDAGNVCGALPLPGFDLTPVGFAVSGALLAWAMVRRRFLAVPPMALTALFAGMREGVLVVTADGLVAAANPAARRMLGLPDDPAGEPAGDLLRDHPALLDALREGRTADLTVEREGARRRIEVSIEDLRGSHAGFTGRLATLRDVTEVREAAEAVARREAILNAVREIATRWLRKANWRDDIQTSLLDLGVAADASRAYIFQNQPGVTGRVCISQLYEWCAPGVAPQIDNPRLQRTTFGELGHARVEAVLSTGGVFSSTVSALQPEERWEFESESIRSILLVPIFASGRWWGFIGLDECRSDRAWTAAETEALRTAAEAFGAAIEREDMEVQRRDSIERLRFIMDNIPGILWAVDRDLHPTVLSGSALPSAGIGAASKDPVPQAGDSGRAPFGPDSIDRHRRVLEGESFDYTLELRGRQFDCHLRPLCGPHGVIQGAIGIALDVTERTRAEEAVRRLTDRLLLATRASGVGIWELDARTGSLIWDDRMREIYGWAAPTPVTQDVWYALIHPEDRARVRGERSRAFTEGHQLHLEFRIVRPDGQTRLLRSHGVLERDGEGQVVRAVGMNLDITDIRRIEREQAKLATAVGQSAEVTVITDPNGRIEYVNPAFERTTGYRRDEVLGRTPAILKSGRQDGDFYADLWSTIRSGRTWTGHFVNRRKDGTLYEADATISPVVDAAGTIENFVAEMRDVTQERMLEEQLRQAQKMESIGRLAGGIAHDFNNNLQTILGFCELLLLHRAEGDPERADILQVQKAAQHARGVTSQLLAFGRRQLIQPKDLDLNAMIGEQHELLARTLGEDIRLDLRLGADIGRARADPAQIQQVLLNLVINARDAMPSGGRLLVATSRREFEADDEQPGSDVRRGRYVCLSVCDTGTGMSPATVAHLFEPFFTTKDTGKGTGLGLAVVHGIVKQHEGWIHVYTEPGQGSEFKIFLPAVDRPKGRDTAVEAPDGAPPRGRGERILLVEDEPGPRLVAVRVLRDHGYHVMEAGNVADARRGFQESPPVDLVISDVVLPDGNGVELVLAFREARPGLPVVMMSGYADERARWPEIRERKMPFLLKPFSIAEILDTVARALAASADGKGGGAPCGS